MRPPWLSCPVLSRAISRREMLRAGSLGLMGMSLPQLLAADAVVGAKPRGKPAKSCILFFLEGGPSHIDLWDMKPQAPSEVRGEFQPIATSVPGVHVCEHLPMLAAQMHHGALVRSVHHTVVDHNAGAYYTLTGRPPWHGSRLITSPSVSDFPPFGAVLGKLMPTGKALPPFVHLPEFLSNNGSDLPGQQAGFLGRGYSPFVAGDASTDGYRPPGLDLRQDVPPYRFQRRFDFLDTLYRYDRRGGAENSVLRGFQAQAYDLLTSEKARAAFRLQDEPQSVRERYGLADRADRGMSARQFGGLPHLGQCMLLARRLVEAGVRLVTVSTGRRLCQAWDTHRDHFPLLKKSLLPYTDRAFSALLEDLDQRGLLQETLVVAMGEFGRTPRLGQITSSAGATRDGRDHWPHCYTVMLAGGGIQGGAVYGESDAEGAFPSHDPVTPEDIAATIYQAMGLRPDLEIHDQFDRPHALSIGTPIAALFA